MMRRVVDWDARAQLVAAALSRLYGSRTTAFAWGCERSFRSSEVARAVESRELFDVTRVGQYCDHRINAHLRGKDLQATYCNGWFTVRPFAQAGAAI